jgi:membrane protein implicated in regulation of membrane protease activity
MTWSDFYLFCFIVGFALSVISFLAGAVHIHLPFKMHVPFHLGHHSHAGGGVHGGYKGGLHLSWFNTMTVMTFLAWFGGVGYLLTNHSRVVAMVAVGLSIFSGMFAAALVFRFMARIVKATDARLMDWDYRIEGALGTVTAPIRANGTGEVTFEQNGVRKSLSAKTEDKTPLVKGAEVVIFRYDNGIAYVKQWDEFTK